MGALKLRPLWLILLALPWVAVGFILTPLFDQITPAVEGEDALGRLLLLTPWLAWGIIGFAASLIWVHAKPGWHPWRDAIWSAVVWAGAIAAHTIAVNRLDLALLFSYHDHAPVAMGAEPFTASMYFLVPAIMFAAFVPVSIFVGLAAANKIWATPTPKRDEVFGPRDRLPPPTA